MDIAFLGLDPTERAQTNRLLVKDEFIYNSLYCLYRQPLFLSQASNLDIKQFSWWRIVSGSVTDNSNTKILEKRVFRMSIVMPGKYIVCVCIYIYWSIWCPFPTLYLIKRSRFPLKMEDFFFFFSQIPWAVNRKCNLANWSTLQQIGMEPSNLCRA